jgi:hypothetical protein
MEMVRARSYAQQHNNTLYSNSNPHSERQGHGFAITSPATITTSVQSPFVLKPITNPSHLINVNHGQSDVLRTFVPYVKSRRDPIVTSAAQDSEFPVSDKVYEGGQDHAKQYVVRWLGRIEEEDRWLPSSTLEDLPGDMSLQACYTSQTNAEPSGSGSGTLPRIGELFGNEMGLVDAWSNNT